jgi:hypothetical protein
VPHFACRFCLAKDARPFENAIALASIQNLTVEAHNDYWFLSFPCVYMHALSLCFER